MEPRGKGILSGLLRTTLASDKAARTGALVWSLGEGVQFGTAGWALKSVCWQWAIFYPALRKPAGAVGPSMEHKGWFFLNIKRCKVLFRCVKSPKSRRWGSKVTWSGLKGKAAMALTYYVTCRQKVIVRDYAVFVVWCLFFSSSLNKWSVCLPWLKVMYSSFVFQWWGASSIRVMFVSLN